MSVTRIHPESKTGLIKWIEDNFHDIDEFVVQFHMKDETSMFVYDTHSYRNALGMLEMAKESCYTLSLNGEFVPNNQ